MVNSDQDIGFGGGCHWCTEAVFHQLSGVHYVKQGFIKSSPPDESWSEAVIVSFDEADISLSILIEIHLRTHASNSPHKMRGKYRSAIYVFQKTQHEETDKILTNLQTTEQLGLETRILDHIDFKSSNERYHNYYRNAPDKPFCKNYIDPKLKLLRSEYTDYIQST